MKRGHVNSITLFAKCHHGWSYHPTKIGKQHPHLNMDLLRAQYDACKEIDVNAPIYLSAGVDNVASEDHPEWRELSHEGQYQGWNKSPLAAGFHKMDFASPYLEYLCDQIREVAELFPDNDGIFLDIISQGQSCTKWSLKLMAEHGLDPEYADDRAKAAQISLDRYYQQTTEACKAVRADTPVFHNSGHIHRGNRDVLQYFSHLELESLPTGGWGYDHFPVSAKYVSNLGMDFLGMTGKFHTTWGEFGGFKHPNALRYECAAMLAFGSKCSIGDQLHPNGELDESTYAIVGEAYSEVEAKEPWCDHVKPIADVGVLSSMAAGADPHGRDIHADDGAARMLLESHFLFDVVDKEMDFSPYRVMLLPDDIVVDAALKTKLDAYLIAGGKLMLTGKSGLASNGGGMMFDIGAAYEGESPFQPDYVLPREDMRPGFASSPMVMYLPSQRVRVTDGESLGDVFDPYFNRSYKHFCSHQHAPNRPEASGYAAGVRKGNVLYLAHPVFSNYKLLGNVALREYVAKTLAWFLGDDRTVTTKGLPSAGRVALNVQPAEGRHVLHVLYANKHLRGGHGHVDGPVGFGGRSVEVIEELDAIDGVEVTVRLSTPISKAMSQPSGEAVAMTVADGIATLKLPRFSCHEMIVLE